MFRSREDIVAALRCSPQLTAAFFSGQKLRRRGFELQRRFGGFKGLLQG